MASVRYRQRGKKRLWDFYIRDENGKTIESQSGFKTKKEAQNVGDVLLQKINSGSVLNKNMTLPELYNIWYDLKIKGAGKSETTLQKYLQQGVVIEKLFEAFKLKDIRPTDYQRVLNDYGVTVSRDYLGRINSSIRKCIIMAQQDKIMIDDFTQGVILQSLKKGQEVDDKFIHSEKDYQTIINALIDKFDYKKSVVPYVIYFLFKTGMRYGELIALTWKDIDFKGETLKTYRRYNTSIHKFVQAKNETSKRIIPLDTQGVEIFSKMKIEQKRCNDDLGVINSNNFVFQHYTLEYDIPLIETTNKALRLLLKNLSIKPIITSKGARHTYGSILLLRGIDIAYVAKIMGHVNTSMLIKVYGHLLEERDKEMDEAVRKMLY